MLFIIGTKDSNIKNGFIANEKCSKCGIENTLDFSIFRRYVHITSIPLFPVGKTVNIECTSCKNWFYYEDLALEAQEKLKNEKLQISLWMFSGTFILSLFLIYFVNDYFQNQNKTDLLIKEPTIGDIYNIKFSNGYYSTFRIDKITNDSIYTIHNDYNAYLPYEVDNLDKDENYTNNKVSYSKNDLIKLYQNNEIIKVRRKVPLLQTEKLEYKIPVTR